MTVRSVDVGFVSASDALVGFYRTVLGLEELEPRRFPGITVYRLALPAGALKVTVPETTPAPLPSNDDLGALAGLRYMTLWVDDLDGVVERWLGKGGRSTFGPAEIRPGVRTAMLADPDGNLVEVMEQQG